MGKVLPFPGPEHLVPHQALEDGGCVQPWGPHWQRGVAQGTRSPHGSAGHQTEHLTLKGRVKSSLTSESGRRAQPQRPQLCTQQQQQGGHGQAQLNSITDPTQRLFICYPKKFGLTATPAPSTYVSPAMLLCRTAPDGRQVMFISASEDADWS